MSYFDSRVGECPVWQVVLIRVVKVGINVEMKANLIGTKVGLFRDNC